MISLQVLKEMALTFFFYLLPLMIMILNYFLAVYQITVDVLNARTLKQIVS